MNSYSKSAGGGEISGVLSLNVVLSSCVNSAVASCILQQHLRFKVLQLSLERENRVKLEPRKIGIH